MDFRWERFMENQISGFVLDYFFSVWRYSTRHLLPVHKSLPSYAGTVCYDGNKFDPLALSEGVEEGNKLSRLPMFDVIIGTCHYQI